MDLFRPTGEVVQTATLVVISPSGSRTQVAVEQSPFLIGRHAENHLVLRDNRASRSHARILSDHAGHYIEDLQSRHGVFVNGQRVQQRQKLADGDRIDFGFQDSYQAVFTLVEDEFHRILDQVSASSSSVAGGNNLAKLRALVEVARALQTSLSTHDVLAAVVDAALAVTSTERGFLLLRQGDDLELSVARDRKGASLSRADLSIPTSVINQALRNRRELLAMTFDPVGEDTLRPEMSVADLALRGIVCVPLVHVRSGSLQDTIVSSMADTIGVLYMESPDAAADLSAGNREILQTLALEASTILENARLLHEGRERQRLEEELKIAREIQQGLLPSALPLTGWFRAAGSSVASHQVGGDYFDVRQPEPDVWSAVLADVSGKGVSSALLAALLQGAFLLASEGSARIDQVMSRINRFLSDRTKGEKYATVFYCTVDSSGLLRWANAGHPKPLLVRCATGEMLALETTGMPLGMLAIAEYQVAEVQLQPGDKVVAFSDGLSEAENQDGLFFDKAALRDTIQANAGKHCQDLHESLMKAVEVFTDGAVLTDDITLLVFEYSPE